MTQAQLDRSIAGRTGESPRTIRRRGFVLVRDTPGDLESENIRLVVDCPSCGRPVPFPGAAPDGSPTLAECVDPRCDVYFDFDPADVYATGGEPGR